MPRVSGCRVPSFNGIFCFARMTSGIPYVFWRFRRKRERWFFMVYFCRFHFYKIDLVVKVHPFKLFRRLGFRDRYPCSYGQLMFSGYQDPPPKNQFLYRVKWSPAVSSFFFWPQANPCKPGHSYVPRTPLITRSGAHLVIFFGNISPKLGCKSGGFLPET